MSGFAHIWNLAEVAAWTAGGAHAKPRLEFTVSDPDGDAISSVIFRIYDAAAAGTKVFEGAASGAGIALGYYDANYAMKNRDQASNERWYTTEAIDALGESSGESARTAFKVAWGQAIYEYNGSGTLVGSGSWEWASAAMPAGTQAAFLFANADAAGANRTAWQSSIGAVVISKAYLNVLVRISTKTVGTQPALADMTFSYQATVQHPDNWARSPSGGWSLDTDVRRYGHKSYKCAVASAAYHYIEPFRVSNPDGIVVQPNTDYVFSAHVRTNAALTALHVIRLEVRDAIAFLDEKHGLLTGDEYGDGPGATLNTSPYSEGWQRLHLHYRTGPTEVIVRPIVLYTKADGTTPTNNGDVFWVDALKWEEGTVVSAWTPGFISPAMVFDSYGFQAYAVSGASFGLVKADGTATTLDRVVDGTTGAYRGSGTPEGAVSAPVGSTYRRTDGGAGTSFYIKESGSGNTGWVGK